MNVVLFLLLASAFPRVQTQAQSQPPAELTVLENGGKLTYSLANRTPWRITRYEVVTNFPPAHLSCGIVSEVQKPEDLVRRDVCSVLFDAKGKPLPYTSSIVFVRFDNGMIWKPTNTE